MARLAEFDEIIKRNVSLGPYTHLKLGGPAEMLVQPRSHEELSAVVQAAAIRNTSCCASWATAAT